MAGMEAKAHLTMKITIDSNGICISVTTTFIEFDLLSRAPEVADCAGNGPPNEGLVALYRLCVGEEVTVADCADSGPPNSSGLLKYLLRQS